MERLDLPTWQDLPDIGTDDGSLIDKLDAIKEKWSTGSWWTKWYLWVGLLIVTGILGLVIYHKIVRPRRVKTIVEPLVRWEKEEPDKITFDSAVNTAVTIGTDE